MLVGGECFQIFQVTDEWAHKGGFFTGERECVFK